MVFDKQCFSNLTFTCVTLSIYYDFLQKLKNLIEILLLEFIEFLVTTVHNAILAKLKEL